MKLEQEISQKKFKSENEKMIVNIIYTANYITNQNLKIFKEYEITNEQYNVLRILRGQHPKPATVNLIIERMLDKMSNASRIVDKLCAKGFVVRKTCEMDRRAVDVLITEKGLELLSEIDVVLGKHIKETYNTLSEKEAKTLNNLLDKLRK